MNDDAINQAAVRLQEIKVRHRDDSDLKSTADDEAQVLARFQPIFATDHLNELTANEFQEFLFPRNNRHWHGLARWGQEFAWTYNDSVPLFARCSMKLVPLRIDSTKLSRTMHD